MNHSRHTPASRRAPRPTRKDRQRTHGVGASEADARVRAEIARMQTRLNWTPARTGRQRFDRLKNDDRKRTVKDAADARKRERYLERVKGQTLWRRIPLPAPQRSEPAKAEE